MRLLFSLLAVLISSACTSITLKTSGRLDLGGSQSGAYQSMPATAVAPPIPAGPGSVLLISDGGATPVAASVVASNRRALRVQFTSLRPDANVRLLWSGSTYTSRGRSFGVSSAQGGQQPLAITPGAASEAFLVVLGHEAAFATEEAAREDDLGMGMVPLGALNLQFEVGGKPVHAVYRVEFAKPPPAAYPQPTAHAAAPGYGMPGGFGAPSAQQVEYSHTAKISTVPWTVGCVLTWWLWGGACWGYIAMPFESQKEQARDEAIDDIRRQYGEQATRSQLQVKHSGW